MPLDTLGGGGKHLVLPIPPPFLEQPRNSASRLPPSSLQSAPIGFCCLGSKYPSYSVKSIWSPSCTDEGMEKHSVLPTTTQSVSMIDESPRNE